MDYRYYTYVDFKGYHRCNNLITINQCLSFNRVLGQDVEQFYTINSYDSLSEIVSCPVFIDIDDDLYIAYEKAKDTIYSIRKMGINMPIHVWFSGSKGFHIILPYKVNGARSHEIVREIVSEFTCDYDKIVYRNKSMWRFPSTINRKSGRYKVYLGDMSNLALSKIIDMSEKNISIELTNTDSYDCNILNEIRDSIRLPEYNISMFGNYITLPCVQALLKQDKVEVGYRHSTSFVIARHLYLIDKPIGEARKVIQSLPFYNQIGAELERVLLSVYKSGAKGISCEGADDFLQNFCDDLCFLKVDIKNIFRRN